MTNRGASLWDAPAAETQPGTLSVLAAAVVASLAAGVVGLILVFGQGLLDDPARSFIVAGLVYAAVPGVPSLLVIRKWLPRGAVPVRDLALCVALSATAACLWMVPFLGLFVPIDRSDFWAAAVEMGFIHAVSGGFAGLAFWLLTRSGRTTS